MTAAVWVYGSLGLLASMCAIFLPIETKGRVLPVNSDSFNYIYITKIKDEEIVNLGYKLHIHAIVTVDYRN